LSEKGLRVLSAKAKRD